MSSKSEVWLAPTWPLKEGILNNPFETGFGVDAHRALGTNKALTKMILIFMIQSMVAEEFWSDPATQILNGCKLNSAIN
jgi:hypothetical protein